MDIPVQHVELRSVVAPEAGRSAGRGLLATWHLLSLDAPCVATCWTWFVAHVAHVKLAPVIPVAMFIAVWIVYAADRLLDGHAEDPESLESRHLYHRLHWSRFCCAIVAASAVLVPLVLLFPATILRLYVGLGLIFGGWFALVHLAARAGANKLPKELMPGAFCAAAVFIPVWAGVGFRHGSLAIAATMFAALCTFNCWLIFSWETNDLAEAHPTTRVGVRWINSVGAAMIVLPLTAIPVGGGELGPVFIAIAAAAALLMGLNRASKRLDPTDLRAAADLVLLTPLLVAPFLR